ncbi:hypothetical protein AB0E70_00420 [Streptomyces murinus]
MAEAVDHGVQRGTGEGGEQQCRTASPDQGAQAVMAPQVPDALGGTAAPVAVRGHRTLLAHAQQGAQPGRGGEAGRVQSGDGRAAEGRVQTGAGERGDELHALGDRHPQSVEVTEEVGMPNHGGTEEGPRGSVGFPVRR